MTWTTRWSNLKLKVQPKRTTEKDEDWGAEMGDPACQEECRIGHVARIESAGSEKVSCVVKRHHYHDQAA
jgi:hypothetical protein